MTPTDLSTNYILEERSQASSVANEGEQSAPARRAILVVGMHRSGTSAVTRVLGLRGATLPKRTFGALPENETGFWEPSEIVAIHDEILASAGSSWDDVSEFSRSWFSSDVAGQYKRRLAAKLGEEFSEAPLLIVKDPRMGRLVPLWISVCDSFQAAPLFVIPVRNPLEVAASLKKRNGFPESKSFLLWLRNFLAAERDTRGFSRSFVAYDQLLRDWRGTVDKLGRDLDVSWPRQSHLSDAEIDRFVSHDHRHHVFADEDLYTARRGAQWMQTAFAWAMRAARDRPTSPDELDAVSNALETADLAFMPLVADAQVQISNIAKDLAKLQDDRAAREAELRAANGQIKEAQAKAQALAGARASAEQQNTHAQLRAAQAETQAVRAELTQALASEHQALQEADAARAKLASVVGSTCWRLTWPIRIVGSRFPTLARWGGLSLRFAWWSITLRPRSRYKEWRYWRDLNAIKRAAPHEAAPTADASIVATPALAEPSPAPPQQWPLTPTGWYGNYRREADYTAIRWQGSIRFSIVMPVYKVRPQWFEDAIASVVNQTYPHWELICVDDDSQDPLLTDILRRAASNDVRVRSVVLERNRGAAYATNIGLDQATGDYVVFMDHDDLLEPHALARLGDAAFFEDSDILYGDEVVTGEDAEEILGVQARPIFSHTYYLSHPYFVHPVAVRTTLAREIGGLDISLGISQDIDFVLRALEVARKVTHVPDILYRWRTSTDSTGHARKADVTETTCALKTAHLRRIGFPEGKVSKGTSFNTFSVRYFGAPAGRILGIIPTKNQVGLLRRCVETVRDTTKGLDLDLVVVDHMSDDPETLSYMRELEENDGAKILPYRGKFNYSAINNYAVGNCGSGYDYFLFLNNDIEATKSGWLDAMLDLAMRADVGVVGATLLYPDGTIQHSGVIVGLHSAAEHAFRTLPFSDDDPGYGASLHATREYSAVTAACMLVPATVFHAVHGYDEKLEVGFNDTDLCLRIGQQGHRIVRCAEAVLVHHESASRGKSSQGCDPHPRDSAAFKWRYRSFIERGDPHFSPLLAPDNPTFVLDYSARLAPPVSYDSATDFRPKGRRPPSVIDHVVETIQP